MNRGGKSLPVTKVAVFEVLDPGILTTIQDAGRYGYGQVGVPPSGALDTFSYEVGNLLVGNQRNDASLETLIMGPKLKALREVTVAITGGDLSPTLNGESLEMWRTHLLVEGDLVSFKGVRNGCRAYLAVCGGFLSSKVLGSQSTYLFGRFGGLEGRGLRKGDILFAQEREIVLDRVGFRFPKEWIPSFGKEVTLRVIPGPQDSHFTEKGFETFYSESYQVSPQCDRMGVRLEGPEIERRPDVDESIISESLVAGAIQVPGDGKPIIILRELVTGGYTKIATVITVDLTKVAQLKPGDRVRFTPVSIEEAHLLLRKQETRLRRFKDLFERG